MNSASRSRLLLLVLFWMGGTVAAHAQTVDIDLVARGGSGDCAAAPAHTSVRGAKALQAALARWLPQDAGGEHGTPLVQVVYLVPSDRNEYPLYAQSLDASIRHLQEWYHLETAGGETFTLAAPAVVTLHSTHPEAWYRDTPNGDVFVTFWNNVIQDGLALMGNPSTADRVFLFYVDADSGCGQCGGCGAGSTSGGFVVIGANDLRGSLGGPWVRQCEGDVMTFGFRPCRFVGGMGHELGHAFGLPHPPGCDQGLPSCDGGALMWSGFYGYPNAYLTADDKTTLAAHPSFTPQAFDGELPDCDAFVSLDVPYLLEPHDGRYGGPAPWLVWGDIEEAPSHMVEVATDAAFASVVFAVTTGDEWTRFTDPGAATEYFWRVRRLPAGPWSEVRRFSMDAAVPVEAEPPSAAFHLESPTPNPSSDRTTARFVLPQPGTAMLTVYDALGRRVAVVAEGARPAGPHEVTLDVSRLTPGVYLLRLEAGGVALSRRMVVVR